jgi:hypothetical protein
MKRIAAASIIVLLSGACALAQGTTPPAQAPKAAASQSPLGPGMPLHSTPIFPCIDDIGHFCRAVESDVRRRIACMQGHRTQLTPACRAKLESFEKKATALAAARHWTLDQYLNEQEAIRKRLTFVPLQTPPVKPTAPASHANTAVKPATAPAKLANPQ